MRSRMVESRWFFPACVAVLFVLLCAMFIENAALRDTNADLNVDRAQWRAKFESIEDRCQQDGYGRGSGVCPDGVFTPPTTVTK